MHNPIPAEVWTQHVAILAKTGRGKTIAAKGGASALMKGRLRCGVVDPTAAWWGMRLKADGKTPGFPMVIFGGDHGDVPIDRQMGAKIGALVAGSDWSWIVDISKMGAEDRAPFMTAFAETLFSENRRRLNLFLDECHLYMPQQKLPTKASAHMTAACNNLVSGGRSRGLNITMISQRSAKVHKDSLTQAETLITLGMIAPHDIAAAEAWVKVQGDIKAAKAMLASLPALPTGTGWIYAPELGMLDKVRFPMIDTFDSSRAPGVGEDLRTPTELGQINLEEIRAKLAPTGRKAAAAPLKSSTPMLISSPSKEAAKNNVTALRDQEAAFAAGQRQGQADGWEAGYRAGHVQGYKAAEDTFRKTASDAIRGIVLLPPMPQPPKPPKTNGAIVITPKADLRAAQAPRPIHPDIRAAGFAASANGLGKAERAILAVVAHFPETGVDRAKAALMAGYSSKSGSFRNTLSALRTAGLLGHGDPLVATDAGVAAAGEIDPLPTGVDLLAFWCGHSALGKAEREMLTKLVNALPDGLDRDQLGELTGYSAASGSFRNSLSTLRTLGLITGKGNAPLQAAEEFA